MRQQSKNSSQANPNPDKCSVFSGPERVQSATHTAQREENDAVEVACYRISTVCFCFLAVA